MSEINREPSPVLTIKLNGETEIDLSYANTGVFVFSPAYEEMNHVYIKKDEEKSATYVFHSPALITRLRELWFPTTFMREPVDGDVEAYVMYSANKLNKELDEL